MAEKVALPEKTKVLVAEDSLINRKLLEMLFQRQNIKADFVENGLEVIEKLSENEPYHLILLDLEMPEMDGYQTAIEIRSGLKSNIPIIAMSGHTDVQDKDKCLNLGMNNYVSKPINMEQLYAMMSQLVAAEYETEQADKAIEKQEFNFIDLSYFRTMSGSRPEFELKIFQMFIEDIPSQMGEMMNAIKAADFKVAAQILHKMKSSLMMIGIQKIQPLVAELEEELIHENLNDEYLQQLILIQDTVGAAIAELAEVVLQLKKRITP